MIDLREENAKTSTKNEQYENLNIPGKLEFLYLYNNASKHVVN